MRFERKRRPEHRSRLYSLHMPERVLKELRSQASKHGTTSSALIRRGTVRLLAELGSSLLEPASDEED